MRLEKSKSILTVICLAASICFCAPLSAQSSPTVLCLKSDGSILIKNRRNCPRSMLPLTVENLSAAGARGPQGEDGEQGPIGATGATGLQGAQGPTGATGAQGIDGAFAIYGDGSEGNTTISSTTSLAGANYQYDSFTLSSAATLTVASGTVIRASGNCAINGTINVQTGASGATRGGVSVSTEAVETSTRPGVHGIAQAGGNGQISAENADAGGVIAGYGGRGLSVAQAQNTIRPSLTGGAGGGTGGSGEAGAGGGYFAIICQGTFTLGASATIRANGGTGAAGTGGGGGGVIVLASLSTMSLLGTVEAKGGAGGAATTSTGPGGGGGGGIIHFIAPSISNLVTTDVTGGVGSASTGSGTVTAAVVAGGGGGGGSRGDGGNGGAVFTSDASGSGTNGTVGSVFSILADPTSLLL